MGVVITYICISRVYSSVSTRIVVSYVQCPTYTVRHTQLMYIVQYTSYNCGYGWDEVRVEGGRASERCSEILGKRWEHSDDLTYIEMWSKIIMYRGIVKWPSISSNGYGWVVHIYAMGIVKWPPLLVVIDMAG